MHIRVDDTVEVMTGDDRGERAKVLKVDHNAGKVLVEGVNRVYKHVRRSQRNPQGGRLSKEMPRSDFECVAGLHVMRQGDAHGCTLPSRRKQRTILQEMQQRARTNRSRPCCLRSEIAAVPIRFNLTQSID